MATQALQYALRGQVPPDSSHWAYLAQRIAEKVGVDAKAVTISGGAPPYITIKGDTGPMVRVHTTERLNEYLGGLRPGSRPGDANHLSAEFLGVIQV